MQKGVWRRPPFLIINVQLTLMPRFFRFRRASRLLLLLATFLTIWLLYRSTFSPSTAFLDNLPASHLLRASKPHPSLSPPPSRHSRFHPAAGRDPNRPFLSPSSDSSLPYPRFNPSHRITFVVVWSGLEIPPYLPLFLTSVAANAGRVDLVFVAKQDEKNGMCVELEELGDNVRFVCLSNGDYVDLHVQYLATAWGGLTSSERHQLKDEIIRRSDRDTIHSYFRLFRGEIFKQYFPDPDTTYWGWCDTDTIFGDFETQFAWDIASTYDLIVPSHQVFHHDIQVFMRGHMTVFRNLPTTTALLHTVPMFRSLASYLSSPLLGHGPEESTFSTYLFYHQPNLTFLTFDAMLDGPSKAGLISSTRSLVIERTIDPLDRTAGDVHRLHLIPRLDPNPSTFSTGEGGFYPLVEKESLLEIGVTKEWTWIPVEEAVSYKPTKVKGDVRARRFLRRDVAGGPVIERVEDWTRWEIPILIQRDCFEGLYIHLQAEKRAAWFESLPPKPLENHQILVLSSWGRGAEVWKGKEVVWSSG